MNAEIVYWYALVFYSGLSHGDLHDLLERWRGATGRCSSDLLEVDAAALSNAGLSSQELVAVDAARNALSTAAKALRPCEVAKLKVLTSEDPLYPPLLTETLRRSRPPLLFCAGNVELLREPAAPIIGSRDALPVSLEFARETAASLASHGIVVVSGYAEGVDRAASEAALEAGGATVIFLAQGLLTLGRAKSPLGDWMAQGRLLAISAFAPRAGWQTPFAMARNAMITATVNDVIVAQAREGGAWEAARAGLRQGKRVWIRDDDSPDLDHEPLIKLGAHPVKWPSDNYDEWIGDIANRAASQATPQDEEGELTETEVTRILREGSAAEIHDACGITGHLLMRIIEGREFVRINTLSDLRKIKGLGPSAVREVADAFGLAAPADSSAQLSLFPAVEEFRGWDGDLAPQAGASEPAPAPLPAAKNLPLDETGEQPGTIPHERAIPSSAHPRSTRRKNLLLIVTSQQRADTLGCYANAAARTPHIDSLAEEGTLFGRAYACSSQDMVSRASLLTGMSPRTHGAWTNGVKLPEGTPTLASHLAAHGYRTACVGKVHLSPFSAPPEARSKESLAYWETGLMENWTGPYYGFNQVRLVIGHGPESTRCGHYARWVRHKYPAAVRDLSPANPKHCPTGLESAFVINAQPDAHTTGFVVEQAESFLEEFDGNPFFLMCSFPDPHPPYAALRPFAEQFGADALPSPIPCKSHHDGMPPHFAKALREGFAGGEIAVSEGRLADLAVRELRARNLAMVAQVDEAVGRILKALSDLGLEEETLVVFTSDHGDLLGDHGFIGAGPFHYESLIRVPFVWRMPGVLPAGARVTSVTSHLDFVPTACALIGAERPGETQGFALDALMERKSPSPRSATLVEYASHNLNLKTVVGARHKMTLYPGQPDGELYDLESDPAEVQNEFYNSAARNVRTEMTDLLLEQMASTERSFPPPASSQ